MRLHELEITAFGPFADTVSVDLDQLSDAGLFLLCGDTGAGKTSILDGICFALYGDVPGDRSTARRLRCDTAPPDRAPRVRLVATLAGRRFQITRSPAWQRPKKRGTGLTPQQAAIVLQEEIDGEWVTLSTRLDEAGHLLGELVGMTITQFCQVVMLPQGRFQAFLRATSDERHQLLQHLFSTRRFNDIERWVRDHARGLRRDAEASAQAARAVVHRIGEATGESAPEQILAVAPGSDPQQVVDVWLAEVSDTVHTEDEAAQRLVKQSGEAAEEAAAARDQGRRQADLVQRRDQARAVQQSLADEDEKQAARQDELLAARRALPVWPRHEAALADQRAADEARQAAAQSRDSLLQLLDEADVRALAGTDEADAAQSARAELSGLSGLDERLRHGLADTRALLPAQTKLDGLRSDSAELGLRIAELSDERVGIVHRMEARPDRMAQLVQTHAEAETAAGRLESTQAQLTQADHLLAVHARLTQTTARLVEARDAARDHREQVLTIKGSLLDLRERRIIGMAAELAGKLAVGQDCPVCGSHDHPHKAQAAADAPDAGVERALAQELADAEAHQAAHDDTVRGLESQVARLEGEAGASTVEDLKNSVTTLRAQADADSRSAAGLPELTQRLDALRAEDEADHARLLVLDRDLAGVQANERSITQQAEALLESVTEHLAGTRHTSLTDLVDAQQARVTAAGTARRDAEQAEAAQARSAASHQRLQAALTEHGFASPADLLDAHLEQGRIEALEAAIADHDRRLHEAQATLAHPEIAALGDQPGPDLGALDRELTAATTAHQTATSRRDLAQRRVARVQTLATDLRAAMADWAPLRHQHEVAAELAAFVEGKSADNQFRMRLSAYVLAWRLTQVVDAANDRLGPMTGHRYTLEHTGQRGAGETRGGLSLLVRDVWSGEQRDPATLSGGETFMVSLALALGLSDVVAQESGGHQLDTLFVDEGFGSLDPDSLDDVMGILDELREGGRVVGVVSHVAELRTRIPAQLVVSKSRTGSLVQSVHGA